MASKRRQRRQECGRKKAFYDLDEAWRVCRGQAYHEGRRLEVYRCRWSGRAGQHYHICHTDKALNHPHGGKYAA